MAAIFTFSPSSTECLTYGGDHLCLKNNYLHRMAAAVLGIYGNSKDEALYPAYYVDATGRKLNGAHRYALRFEPGKLPPVDAFWSLTVYEQPSSLLVANRIGRYLLNSTMLEQFRRGAEGTLLAAPAPLSAEGASSGRPLDPAAAASSRDQPRLSPTTIDSRAATISLYCLALLACIAMLVGRPVGARTDPLASWNDGAVKSRIVEFVTAVTEPRSRDYVAPADRIAVFDNDGTLWGEQPAYVQLAFVIDRVKALAPTYPEWQTQQPFNAAPQRGWIVVSMKDEWRTVYTQP